MVKKLPLLVGILVVLAAVVLLGLVLFKNELFPESSPSQRGLLVAEQSGCFNCHVRLDGRGSANPVKGGDMERVPNFFTERHGLDGLRQWIRNGMSDARRRRIEAAGNPPADEALVMPAFAGKLSDSQIEDLVSFVALAQYGQMAERSEDLPKGEALARRFACYTCHGELGQGGVGNPRSLKGYIPGFFGEDFRALTENGKRQDIREWILDGHSRYFWNQGFAGFYPGRYFTERQAIRMPAFRDFLSDDEVETLVDHLIELMNRGPLNAEALIAYRPLPARRNRDRAPGTEGAGSPTAAQTRPPSEMPLAFLAASTVLEQHCVKCHGPVKEKSHFRLDSRAAALRGGELAEATGIATIKPGDARDSLVMRYVTATEEDPFKEIHPMPPDGNPRLTPTEIEILRRWIQEGAEWPRGVTLHSNAPQSERNP
ncbi:MAG: c-type cytochrome [Acidobacteriota bacterium]